MAVRKSSVRRDGKSTEPTVFCRDRVHSYDWQNRSFETGNLILCRCKFYKNGRFCKFLSDAACDNFKPRSSTK